MGFWIPGAPGSAGRPGTLTSDGTALDASNPQGQCKNIFQTMLDVAASRNPDLSGTSINLLTNPGNAPGPFKLPGGSGTGSYAAGGLTCVC